MRAHDSGFPTAEKDFERADWPSPPTSPPPFRKRPRDTGPGATGRETASGTPGPPIMHCGGLVDAPDGWLVSARRGGVELAASSARSAAGSGPIGRWRAINHQSR
jgi:hypothetical protein